jgi:hypothetical protein
VITTETAELTKAMKTAERVEEAAAPVLDLDLGIEKDPIVIVSEIVPGLLELVANEIVANGSRSVRVDVSKYI